MFCTRRNPTPLCQAEEAKQRITGALEEKEHRLQIVRAGLGFSIRVGVTITVRPGVRVRRVRVRIRS